MHISPEELIRALKDCPVLDVRSPGEYTKGHVPGAISFPLFDDLERAEIGTLYKQVGQQAAFDRGMELVGPKIRDMVQRARDLAYNGQLIVHCWRGGMRSQSVAQLLQMSGLEVKVVKGGYKRFRNWVLEVLARDYQLLVLGGMTGSGKTEILEQLEQKGAAVVHLEKLAHHRGSSFGRIGQEGLVTQQQFENGLAVAISKYDDQEIWIEDESRGLGKLILPGKLFAQMQSAPFIYLDVKQERRVEHLLEIYGTADYDQVRSAIDRIRKRLGGMRYQQALQFLMEDQRRELVALLLTYYDKAYQHQMGDRSTENTVNVTTESFLGIAEVLLRLKSKR